MAYDSVNPFDNKLNKSFPEISDKQLEKKMALATACYQTRKHTSYAHRAKIVPRPPS